MLRPDIVAPEGQEVCPGTRLSIEDIIQVARYRQRVASLAPDVLQRIQASADWVTHTIHQIDQHTSSTTQPTAYYGINTGVGALAGKTAFASVKHTCVMGRNLIASHAAGVGDYFDEETMRALMLIRVQSLAQGYSGVRPLVIEKLIAMLNHGVYPAVPQKGSLGASGDLAPLAHLALIMSKVPDECAGNGVETPIAFDRTDGEAFVPVSSPPHTEKPDAAAPYYHITESYATGQQTLWERVSGQEAMSHVGGKITLWSKEALALINASSCSAAIAALVIHDAWNMLANAELAAAMTLEGMRGFRDPFYPHIHRARGHRGAEQVAAHVLRYMHDSHLLDPGDLHTDPVRVPPQDAYSVRCVPQVLGTIRDTLECVQRWVDMEINAATDNPLIFLDLERDYKTISGGNFHGEPIAMAMDFASIALTELGSLSERRIFRLTDYETHKTYENLSTKDNPRHGLNAFLIDEPPATQGLNSGMMIVHATAAALVSDCKTLAHPDSIDSVPTSANQEDHVSMSLNAARHAREIAHNVEHILALEFLCAAQAIALQRAKNGNEHLSIGTGTQAAYTCLREAGIEELHQDRVHYPDIRTMTRMVRNGTLVQAARAAIADRGMQSD